MFKLLGLVVAVQLAISSHGFNIHPKIISGDLSDTTKYPYFAMLSDGTFACSASLLDNSWIITAGHCLTQNIPFNVSLGIRADGTYETTVMVNVSDQHIYPGFFNDQMSYDIGLIRLPQPIQLSETIQPTKLPQSCEDMEAHEAVNTIGIGQRLLSEPLIFSDGQLREGSFRRIDCEQSSYLFGADLRASLCSFTTMGQTTANGDSGGPTIRQTDGVQYGVHHTTVTEYGRLRIQVSARIAFFFDWISATTGLELPKCEQQAPVHV